MSYVHLSRSSFNDEEMHQMLAQNPPFGENKLRKIFRSSRGIIVSKHLEGSELAEYYARLGFSWKQFEELASNLDSEDSIEKRSSIKLPCQLTPEVIDEAITKLKLLRAKDETYIRSINAKTIDVKATYIKTDFSKSKSRLREKKTIGIDVKLDSAETEISYDSDERGAIIVSQLVKEIRKASQTVVPSECEICFSGALKETNQTGFFLALIGKIDGYRRISVSDVKVNRATAKPSGITTDEDANDEIKDQFKGLISSAVLKGEDVTSSKMFQQLMVDGYFISGISWYARELGDEQRKVELEAGFKEDKARSRFFVDAKRIFGKTLEKEDEATAKRLNPFQRATLQKKVIASAYNLFATLPILTDEE